MIIGVLDRKDTCSGQPAPAADTEKKDDLTLTSARKGDCGAKAPNQSQEDKHSSGV